MKQSPFLNKELIKTWRKDHFTLRLYTDYRRDENHHTKISYQFKDGKNVIFQGDDYGCPSIHAIDSLESVYSLLGFLCLQIGDTDKEYFDGYTPQQLAWSESSRCDDLQMLVYEWEERIKCNER